MAEDLVEQDQTTVNAPAAYMRQRYVWLPWAGLVFVSAMISFSAYFQGEGEGRTIALVLGLTVAVGSALKLLWDIGRSARRHWVLHRLRRLMWGDMAACFAVNPEGRILFANEIGQARLNGAHSLEAYLEGLFAQPSAVLYRLQRLAASGQAAKEDVVTHQGLFRLSVYMPSATLYLWRLEEQVDRGLQSRGADGISLPMVVVSETGVVLFANEALRRILGTRPRRLDRVILDTPVVSGAEVTLPGAEGLVRAIAFEVQGAAGRREIYLLPAGAMPLAGPPDEMEDFPVALMRLRDDGLIHFANREARSILGMLPGNALMLSDLVEGLGRPVRDWVADVAAGRLPGRPEILRLRAGDAEEAFVQISIRRLGSRGNGGLLAVVSDATAIKTLEAQFVQSQKMQAIGQLAGGVAHDFNNLLTALSGHCDLLLLRHRPTDPDYSDLQQIRQNANRAAALVRQLLAFSRKQTLTPEILQLPDVFAELSHLLKRLVGERVCIEFKADPEMGPMRADRRQLEQVIMNLVLNARDAMPEGGEISISARREELLSDLPRDRVSVPAGEYVVIRVRDNGTGIAPEHLTKIFEPFFTTKRVGEGTGLGLSTAYGIVKQSGGYIFVESQLGQFTEFVIYFPMHDIAQHVAEAEAIQAHSSPEEEAEASNGVVLLVEDEAPVRAFAARALRLRGFTVIEAEHAEAALEVLTDKDLAVDVFVTDVIMPGMDGPSWVKEALRERPQTKVIFISGYAEESFADAHSDLQGSLFLPKPFSLDDLTKTVMSQMH